MPSWRQRWPNNARHFSAFKNDLPVLARARLLKPLANPAPNAPKHYATCELAELAQDRAWLSRVTSARGALAAEEREQKYRASTRF